MITVNTEDLENTRFLLLNSLRFPVFQAGKNQVPFGGKSFSVSLDLSMLWLGFLYNDHKTGPKTPSLSELSTDITEA